MNRNMLAITTLIGALTALPVLTSQSEAQTYRAQSHYGAGQSYEACLNQQRNRQVTGAVIGGVLGAVIGSEIDNDSYEEEYYSHRRWGRGHGRRHHERYRYRYRERDNDGAVLVGAGLGALAGSAIAGQSGGCERLARGGYPQPVYRDHGYSNDYNQYDRYDQGYSQPQSSSDVLLGGQDYGYDEPAQPYQGQSYTHGYSQPRYETRTYTTNAAYSASAACRDMRSGNGAITLMCQGPDGIWRPAQ